ncbi:LOW QUALITY PROTEIN: 26S proteasome non-ATPase regulatory subunit 9-like [Dermacentor silvarum]|uniref:LOW QUALITY PROTEIN: 26S proteasome non-ATPase regulatory subunit 9-like n=1 Tax=Dermacentor silvarum TaxID=543639 RepID=UPI001896ED2F|nr:LOW QUALITY PROTEIN: 26S proteasome non-ATPase regulatory subunit 9-like [Dermacentor silvarum]
MLDQKQILSRLTQRKLEIEAAISAQHEILNANSIGMDEPLVDNEGYPRSDIDVYKVRHARHRIICLLNDHRRFMKDIEKSLHDYHAQMSRNGAENGGPATVTQQQNVARGGSAAAPLPFAVVGKVENGSPADIAGLSAGDKIVKFGSVNAGNFKDVTDIAAVVQHSVGRPVNVLVKRDANAVSVVLTPKQWHGKGLLGCTVLPMS